MKLGISFFNVFLSQFSQFLLAQGSSFFLFSEQIYLIIMNESVLMLYYIAFLTVTS